VRTVLLDEGLRRTDAPNGLVVVTERLPGVRSAAVGVWVRSASGHEPRAVMGVSHLLEHMVFKGTERRTARDIASALEDRGGSLDAFTSRDHTSYQAHVLAATSARPRRAHRPRAAHRCCARRTSPSSATSSSRRSTACSTRRMTSCTSCSRDALPRPPVRLLDSRHTGQRRRAAGEHTPAHPYARLLPGQLRDRLRRRRGPRRLPRVAGRPRVVRGRCCPGAPPCGPRDGCTRRHAHRGPQAEPGACRARHRYGDLTR
jgi:hypothetical protein